MGNSETKAPTCDLQAQIHDCVDPSNKIDFEKLAKLRTKWQLTECDIAIIGRSGVGKSSLINNLLGVPRKSNAEELRIKQEIKECKHTGREDCNHTYAPADSSECTTDPVPYTFKKDKKVCLWDLPGYGAQLVPTADHFVKKFNLSRFDAFLFITPNNRRPSDNFEGQLVRYLLQQAKPVFWVRTRFDEAMNGKEPEDEVNEREKIFTEYLEKLGVATKPKVYCVSGLFQIGKSDTFRYLYDLDELKGDLVESMPEHIQFNMLNKFQSFSERLINTKYVLLQKWAVIIVLGATGKAVGAGFLPVAGPLLSSAVDVGILIAYYRTVEDMYDLSSMEALIEQYDLKVSSLLYKQYGIRAANVLGETLAQVGSGVAFSTIAEVVASLVPIIGATVAGAICGSAMTWGCHSINSTFRDCALQVLKAIDEEKKQKLTKAAPKHDELAVPYTPGPDDLGSYTSLLHFVSNRGGF